MLSTEETADPDRVLCVVARRDLTDAVDLLFSLPPPDQWDQSAAELAARVVAYCRHRERLSPGREQLVRYPWLATVSDDDELVDELLRQAGDWDLGADLQPTRRDRYIRLRRRSQRLAGQVYRSRHASGHGVVAASATRRADSILRSLRADSIQPSTRRIQEELPEQLDGSFR